MNAGRARRQDSESVPQIPQSTPFLGQYGQPNHDFTLQAVMEMQKTVGELNASVQALKGSVDGVKVKVDDLVSWKHKIIGGVAVLSIVATILGFLIAKASEYVTLKPGVVTSTVPSITPPSPAAPVPVPK